MEPSIGKQDFYIQTIKDAYPRLEIASARLHTNEGQFNDILFINEELIFRFPRYKENIKIFVQEIELLQKLQGHSSLPIPDPIYVSTHTDSVGKLFMGYKMLAGKPLLREIFNAITDESTVNDFARQLANFLYKLHTLSPAALELNLPVQNKLSEYKAFYSNIQANLFTFMRPEARKSVSEQFESYFNNSNSALHHFVPTLIHGDFGGSNILFVENKITGIIDFSFAGLGDPAVDIAAISTFGDSFLDRIRGYYPNIEPLLERAKFYRSTFALYEALHGFRNNDGEAFRSGMEQYV
jgi:aminoglycoside 2''-phosphotransferase